MYVALLLDPTTGNMEADDGWHSQQIRERAKLFDAFPARGRSVSTHENALSSCSDDDDIWGDGNTDERGNT